MSLFLVLRILLGSALGLIFILIFSQQLDWFPAFHQARDVILNFKEISIVRAVTGIVAIHTMAAGSVWLILFAKATHNVFLGAFLALVTFSLLALF